MGYVIRLVSAELVVARLVIMMTHMLMITYMSSCRNMLVNLWAIYPDGANGASQQ